AARLPRTRKREFTGTLSNATACHHLVRYRRTHRPDRRQFPERRHCPVAVGEKPDLARFALRLLLSLDSLVRQHPVTELPAAARALPILRRAVLGALFSCRADSRARLGRAILSRSHSQYPRLADAGGAGVSHRRRGLSVAVVCGMRDPRRAFLVS